MECQEMSPICGLLVTSQSIWTVLKWMADEFTVLALFLLFLIAKFIIRIWKKWQVEGI